MITSKDILPDRSRGWLLKLDLSGQTKSRVITLYKALLAAEKIADNKELLPMAKWTLETTDRYWYCSGRNQKKYREVSYWYKPDTLERKETMRELEIFNGEDHKLPDWCKTITERKRTLEIYN